MKLSKEELGMGSAEGGIRSREKKKSVGLFIFVGKIHCGQSLRYRPGIDYTEVKSIQSWLQEGEGKHKQEKTLSFKKKKKKLSCEGGLGKGKKLKAGGGNWSSVLPLSCVD